MAFKTVERALDARAEALTRRDVLAAMGAASLAACAAPGEGAATAQAPDAQPQPPRPPAIPRHLFLLVSDDQSRFDVGCYGNNDVQTPNIDRLAAEGLRFERGYTPVGVCKPARSAMYTGLYPHKNGAAGFDPIHAGVPTWTELLTPDVCATGMIGKLNTKPLERFQFERWVRPRVVADTRDLDSMRTALDQMIDGFGERRMAIVVNLKDPHRPFRGPFEDPEFVGAPVPHEPSSVCVPPHLYDTPEARAELAKYYDAIWRLDRTVGVLLAVLERRGLAHDSLVLFTSDNGQSFPFAKTTLYEAGINVPFIARWPAVVAPGGVSTEFVSLLDFLPTALDMFGVDPTSAMDGSSLLPLLRGEVSQWRDGFVGQHTQHLVGDATPSRSLRDERFKYILNIKPDEEFANNVLVHSDTWRSWVRASRHDPDLRERMRRLVQRPREELYDLQRDPYELVNLAGNPAHDATLAALRERLLDWMRREGDPYTPA